jgi:hypothetical protein
MQELLNAARKDRTPRELSVGIRNVSSETISIPSQLGEEELVLHPTPRNGDDPHAVAIISLARWQLLRKSKLMGFGMITRDDRVLGEVDTKAPDDRPEELHPDHAKNLVLDPHAWITSRDEPLLRQDIGGMTSESSLRRLWAAVDEKVGELERHVPVEERRGIISPGIKKAISNLPMLYRLTEQLVEERLDELLPLTRDIPDVIKI